MRRPLLEPALRSNGAEPVLPPDAGEPWLYSYKRMYHVVRIYPLRRSDDLIAVFSFDWDTIALRLDGWKLTACMIECGYGLNLERPPHTRVG